MGRTSGSASTRRGRRGAAALAAVDAPRLVSVVLPKVDAPRLVSVVLPKVDARGDLAFAERLLAGAEALAAGGRGGPLRIQALVETAAGLARVEKIAGAGCERLEALISPRCAPRSRGPACHGALGEHSEEVLADVLRLGEGEIARLFDAGIVAGPA